MYISFSRMQSNEYIAISSIICNIYIAMKSPRPTARQRELARNQLEHVVARLRPLAFSLAPPKGWVRAIRDALGMTAGQLAERMKVTRQRIAAIEHSEVPGATTLDTLRRAAAAMDCTLVYAFVPTRPLEEIVRQKAR